MMRQHQEAKETRGGCFRCFDPIYDLCICDFACADGDCVCAKSPLHMQSREYDVIPARPMQLQRCYYNPLFVRSRSIIDYVVATQYSTLIVQILQYVATQTVICYRQDYPYIQHNL